MSPKRASRLAWLGLTSYIAAYDAYAILFEKQTMSAAFWEALEHPKQRLAVLAAWMFVTKHLVLPTFCPRIDPLNLMIFPLKAASIRRRRVI